MRILVTNDDGPQADGLMALFSAASAFGDPVAVVPAHPHSMKSHAVTTGRPIEIKRLEHAVLGSCYICDATPADCVRLGLLHLEIGPIDVVLSGINHGANAGVDVFYSGTVAAAREAALLGCRGVAVSQLLRSRESDNWERARRHTERVLRDLLCSSESAAIRQANVNLPDPLDGQELQGIKHCPLAPEPLASSFSRPPETAAGTYRTRFNAAYFDRPAPAGFDFHWLLNNWITVTPLLSDLTDHAKL